MTRFPGSARWLLRIMTFGSPLLVVLFAWTGWDAAQRAGWRYGNPITWGFGGFIDGVVDAERNGITAAVDQLITFYRSDPWGNWVLVDHLGLKILLSFLLCWDAWDRKRRVWPYVIALYVVGALASIAYLWPILRAAAGTAAHAGLDGADRRASERAR